MRKHHANVKKPINMDSIGKGKKSLSVIEIENINRILGKSKVEIIRDMMSVPIEVSIA